MADSKRNYSLNDWLDGIAAAERAGDHAAAARLREDATRALTGPGTVMERIGAGVADVTNAIGRWTGRVSPEQFKEHQRIAAMADPSGVGRAVGQMAATAPVMLIPGVNTVAGGALAGGAVGAALDPDSPLTGGLVGGATGGALPLVGRLMQGRTTPIAPAAQKLLNADVPVTPGQVLGGAAQRAENALTSLPFSAVPAAYERGIEGFNRAIYRRALDPLDRSQPLPVVGPHGRRALSPPPGSQSAAAANTLPVGRAGVAGVEERLSRAYDELLPHIGFKADPPFMQNVGNVRQMMYSLPEEQQRIFDKVIDTTFNTRTTPQGLASGESIKAVESELRRVADTYRRDPAGANRELALALDEVRSQVRQALARQNPQAATRLRDIDEGWAHYARLRNAAARQGTDEGAVTPAQFSAAVREGDSSYARGRYAKGQAFDQDLSDAGRKVLMTKTPDSGTALRAGVTAGLTTAGAVGGAVMGNTVQSPETLAGGVLGLTALPASIAALYSPTGRRLVVGAITKQRPRALRQTGAALRRAGVPAAAGLIDEED